MGREEIFIDLWGGAPKKPIFNANMTQIRNFTVFAACDAHMLDGLRTLDPEKCTW